VHLLCDWVVVGSNLIKNEINFFIFANIIVAWMWKGKETLVTMGLQGGWEKQLIMVYEG